MKLESGQTIARYRLVEPIGEGGMGVVWRADDLELGRPVALKFLTAEALASEDRRARFLREARTAASLNHPGICTIYEVGEHDRVPFIAMELIEGTTLDDLVRKGDRLPLSQILRLASVEAQIYRNFDSSEARIQRAERLAQRAMELDLESARAHRALGEIAAMRYDYERAVRLFREATHLEPAEPMLWDLLSWALAYQTPPDSAGAVSAARKAIELQPDFSGAFYHLGRALLQMGEHEEARAAFERCIELNPKSNTGFLGMAQYHLALGDYDSAMAAANEIWEGAVIELFYVSLIHAAAGETDQALQRLDETFAMGFRDFVSLDSSPYLSELRNDARYHELVRRYRDR